jgi:hypothetical protein
LGDDWGDGWGDDWVTERAHTSHTTDYQLIITCE